MVVVQQARFSSVDGPGFNDEMREGMRQRKAATGEVQMRSMEDYALRIPAPKIGTLDLYNFPYLREPFYSDEIAAEEEVVAKKATQVGASEGNWRWLLRQVDLFGETGIYYFPTDNHVTDFNDERVDPAIAASPYLQSRLSGVNQKHLKQFGAGTLYFRGVKSLTAVQSVAADCLVFDEYDESDQKNISQAERRISGARAAGRTPRIRRFGRPTLPGYGIAERYDSSDQRVWLVTCPKCDKRQELRFGDNVRWKSEAAGDEVLRGGEDSFEQARDVTDVWRACAKCGTRLDPLDRRSGSPIHDGEWVAQKKGPGRVPGYHVTRLIVPFTDLRQLVEASRSTRPFEIETFYWADLGVEYAAADAQLTDSDILNACSEGYQPMEEYRGRFPVTMGVDVASERDLSVRISERSPDGRRRGLTIREVKSFEDLDVLMHRYRVHICCIDSQPERRSARAFASRFPGHVYLVTYVDKADVPAIAPAAGDDMHVKVNRTEAIDAMMDSIRQFRNLPVSRPPEKYVEQLKSPKRRTEEDARGNRRRVYVSTGSQGDDYAHAEVYDLVASEIVGQIEMAGEQMAHQEQVVDPEAVGVPQRGAYEYTPGFER